MDENYTSLAVLEKEMFVSALTGHCCSSRPGVIRREAPRAAPAEHGRETPCLAPCGGDGAEPEQQIHAPGSLWGEAMASGSLWDLRPLGL